MAKIIEITDTSHPGLLPFTSLTEAQLRNRLTPTKDCLSPRVPR